MNYDLWNAKISNYFFNESKSQKEVLLYVNEDVIKELGEELKDPLGDFIAAIKDGPRYWIKGSVCKKAYNLFENWRFNFEEGDCPPYIAYLAFFVLAATRKDDSLNSNAYYSRLGDLTGEEGHLSFDKMELLWKDLILWCNKEHKGNLGIVVSRARGKWRHVGWPWSQALISDNERADLRQIFYFNNLDPKDNLPIEEVLEMILSYGRNILKRRTMNLIAGGDKETKEILYSIFSTELANWDGKRPPISVRGSFERYHNLRICLNIDNANKKVSGYFRVNMPDEDFEGTLSLKSLKNNQEIFCDNIKGSGHEGRWSTKMKLGEGEFFDFVKNWIGREDEYFLNDNKKIRVRYGSDKIRIFLRGERNNLPDWVENQKLLRSEELYILAHKDHLEPLKTWGIDNCEEFSEKLFRNIPKDWSLFYVKNVRASCEGIKKLTLPTLVSLRLLGSSIDHSIYLSSNPPKIFLENAIGDEKVFLNGDEIHPEISSSGKVWNIEGYSGPLENVLIEVRDGGDNIIKSRRIFLSQAKLPNVYKLPGRDCLGEITGEILGEVTEDSKGGLFGGSVVKGKMWSEIPKLSPGIIFKSYFKEIILLGAHVGEIKHLTRRNMKDHLELPHWEPVWALLKNKGAYDILNARILNELQMKQIIDFLPIDKERLAYFLKFHRERSFSKNKNRLLDFLKFVQRRRSPSENKGLSGVWDLLMDLEGSN